MIIAIGTDIAEEVSKGKWTSPLLVAHCPPLLCVSAAGKAGLATPTTSMLFKL